MSNAHRANAMGRVIAACDSIKDKRTLADTVRQIVSNLQSEEQTEPAADDVEELALRISALPDDVRRYVIHTAHSIIDLANESERGA